MHKFRDKIGHGAVVHELKSDPAAFLDILTRDKQVEIRLDDREYEVNDYILLRQTQWGASTMKAHNQPLIYTGRTALVRIVHIQTHYGLNDGYVALSIRKLD